MRIYTKDSSDKAACSRLMFLLLMLWELNGNSRVAARSVSGQRFHQPQQLQQQQRLRHQRLHGGSRTAIALPIWRTVFSTATAEHDVENSRALEAGAETTSADVSKRRLFAMYDDVDDDVDDDDDYDDNLQNYADGKAEKAQPEFVYIKPKPKPAHRSSTSRSQLIARATTPAPAMTMSLLGRNVDTPTQTSHDESRTFFKHKGQMGPQFIVLTTPLNLTNINNNNITTATSTTPAPARRIAYIDDGYAPTGLFRSPILRSAFRRRAHADHPPLPYGLLSSWDDSAQVLPLAAAATVLQGGGDLRYVPLDLRRLTAAQVQAQAQAQAQAQSQTQVASFGYGSSISGTNEGSVNDDDDDDGDDFGNALQAANAGYNRFAAPWRNNPNRFNANHRNVYESSNPFAAFANTFKRVQYL